MKAIKIFAVALAAAFAVACGSNSSVKIDGVELPSAAEVDSVSYLIGVNFAEDINDLDMAQMKKGMQDFLKSAGDPSDADFGAQFDIDPNKMGDVLNGFLAKKATYMAAVNLMEEKEFLAKNAKKENVDTTASGLQYTIIAEGAAEKVGPQDTVWVNYKGTLIDGTVFDQNENIQFIANRVIEGWTEGLGLLGEGGKATLYIPARLAYGERGNRGIEPNSTLIFDVEVLKVGKFVPSEK